MPENKPDWKVIFIWRMLWLAISVIVLSFTYPLTSSLYKAKIDNRRPVLEISSLNPKEKIVLTRTDWPAELVSYADAGGVVKFPNIHSGLWRITEGGPEELKKFVIPIRENYREYYREIKHGSIRIGFE